jgi:putative oxidoreductase
MNRDGALLLLRISGLLLALGHGWAKVESLSTGQGGRLIESVAAMGFPMPVVFAWAAALSEFVGGLCVALGLFTRYAAGAAAFTMAVACFGRHHGHRHFLSWLGVSPVAEEQLKTWGNPEPAFVFLLVMVGLALLGPGRYALDTRLGRK